jgi:hypothetical protein
LGHKILTGWGTENIAGVQWRGTTNTWCKC